MLNSMVQISVKDAMASPWMVHGKEKPDKPEWRKGMQKLEAGVYVPFSFIYPAEGVAIFGPKDNDLLIFYLTGHGIYANREAIRRDLFKMARAQGLRDVVGYIGDPVRAKYYKRWGATLEPLEDRTLVRLSDG